MVNGQIDEGNVHQNVSAFLRTQAQQFEWAHNAITSMKDRVHQFRFVNQAVHGTNTVDLFNQSSKSGSTHLVGRPFDRTVHSLPYGAPGESRPPHVTCVD